MRSGKNVGFQSAVEAALTALKATRFEPVLAFGSTDSNIPLSWALASSLSECFRE